jgi:hypothetical protein
VGNDAAGRPTRRSRASVGEGGARQRGVEAREFARHATGRRQRAATSERSLRGVGFEPTQWVGGPLHQFRLDIKRIKRLDEAASRFEPAAEHNQAERIEIHADNAAGARP